MPSHSHSTCDRCFATAESIAMQMARLEKAKRCTPLPFAKKSLPVPVPDSLSSDVNQEKNRKLKRARVRLGFIFPLVTPLS